MTRPVIGIACSSHFVDDSYEVQMTGRRTIDSVRMVSDGLPLLIPGLPDAVDIGDLCASIDGIVFTGSRANVHPSHYGEELGPEHGAMDEDRDAVMLPLVRAALDLGIPMLGLCKGIQEMNVALGGTLYPEVGALPGRHRHRMLKGCRDHEIVFEPRERVTLKPGGVVAQLLGREEIWTNSLHGQAVATPGSRVVVEGWADDQTVEAISIEGAQSFSVGVQWHAEYDPHIDAVGKALFAAFGDDARKRQSRRLDGTTGRMAAE